MEDTEDYSEEATPTAHHESHEDGGSDEIELHGLALDPVDMALDTTDFDGILSGADDNPQKALDTVDDHGHAQLHTQNTDQMLDEGGPFQVEATQVFDAVGAIHRANSDTMLDSGEANQVTSAELRTAVDISHAQLHATEHVTGGGDIVANAVAAGNSGLMTGADKTKLDTQMGIHEALPNVHHAKLHAADHTNGTDDIQDATAAQKGLMTLDYAGKLDGVAAGADVTGANAPKAHAASHKSAGGDVIKLDEFGTPTDVITLNSSTTAHGLLKKLDNVVTNFLNGQGNWTEPAGAAGFVDRGDPAAFDWDLNDFTTDGTWRDINCSSIVPEGAKAILFSLLLNDDATSSYFQLRKKGNTHAVNISYATTQAIDVYYGVDLTCPCDTNRYVQYNAKNLTFTNIYLTVKGWYL